MGTRLIKPIHIWAMRDILRRPGEASLLAAVLCLIVVLSGTPLLLTQSLSSTARKMIGHAPSLVVRKISATGWTPMPEKEAVDSAETVPGVTRAVARVWGIASGPDGAVTVVGLAGVMESLPPDTGIDRLPLEGEAVIGGGVGPSEGESLQLAGTTSMIFRVIGRFSEDKGMAAHDVVLLHKKDAMRLLGLPEGFASDLAVHVFNEEEQSAILPDLAKAFPWPVRITTRRETAGYYSASYSKRGGIVVVALIPSIMALALLMFYLVRERTGRNHEVGLLKSLGWTTVDIVRVQVSRSLFISLPAAALGSLISYVMVFRPGTTWPGSFFFGWDRTAPALNLDAAGAVLVLLEIACLVIVPFVAAALWPALQSGAADPQELIEEQT